MGLYLIEKPCSFAVDGRGVAYRKTGAVVELDEATAASLGDAVCSLARAEVPAPDPEPQSDPEPTPDPEDSFLGPILEPADETPEPEPAAEKPKPRNRRRDGRSDGED